MACINAASHVDGCDCDSDPLSAARGCCIGVLFGVAFWSVMILCGVVLW